MRVATEDPIVDALRSRDGIPTQVRLRDGRQLAVINIAWGYDDGELAAHVSTNISPSVAGYAVDFFVTSDVVEVVDPGAGTTLYGA